MGLFSSEAHVSLDTVRRFKEEVNAFSSEINNVSSTISKQINEGLEEAVQKVKTFEKLLEVDDLNAKEFWLKL